MGNVSIASTNPEHRTFLFHPEHLLEDGYQQSSSKSSLDMESEQVSTLFYIIYLLIDLSTVLMYPSLLQLTTAQTSPPGLDK